MPLPKIAPYPMPTPAELPAGRLDWELDPSRAVLLVHDMQRYFLGAFEQGQSPVRELVDHIGRLRTACARAGVPVVFSVQPGEQSREQRGLLQDLWGDGVGGGEAPEVIAALAPSADDLVLTKWRYSAFVRTDLFEVLRGMGRDQLLVTGIYAHIGCLMTATHAFMEDVQPFVVGDALADFSPEDHRMAVEYAARRCAVVTSTQAAVDALEAPLRGMPPRIAEVRARLGEVIDVPVHELADDDDLLLVGLDSVRIMSLVAEWRRDGVDVSFEELAEQPTIAAWAQLADVRVLGTVPAA